LRALLRIDLVDADVFFGGLDDKARRLLAGNTLIKVNHLLVPGGVLELPMSEVVNAIGAAAHRRNDS